MIRKIIPCLSIFSFLPEGKNWFYWFCILRVKRRLSLQFWNGKVCQLKSNIAKQWKNIFLIQTSRDYNLFYLVRRSLFSTLFLVCLRAITFLLNFSNNISIEFLTFAYLKNIVIIFTSKYVHHGNKWKLILNAKSYSI